MRRALVAVLRNSSCHDFVFSGWFLRGCCRAREVCASPGETQRARSFLEHFLLLRSGGPPGSILMPFVAFLGHFWLATGDILCASQGFILVGAPNLLN